MAAWHSAIRSQLNPIPQPGAKQDLFRTQLARNLPEPLWRKMACPAARDRCGSRVGLVDALLLRAMCFHQLSPCFQMIVSLSTFPQTTLYHQSFFCALMVIYLNCGRKFVFSHASSSRSTVILNTFSSQSECLRWSFQARNTYGVPQSVYPAGPEPELSSKRARARFL